MSEDQSIKLTAEQAVEQELKKVTGVDVSLKEMDALTIKRLKMAYTATLKAFDELSLRQAKRGIMNAVALGIEDQVEAPELVSKEEAAFGGLFAQLLDLRNLQLAANMRSKELEELNNITNEGNKDENTNS